MACFHPLEAWQLDGGEIVFSQRGKVRRHLWLPCGRCIGCRSVRKRSWAIRCMHEAQMHEVSSFVTLTYDQEHFYPSLNYPDFQLFMKRLRKARGNVRFFACGEYGDKDLRPHFHAILFGVTFDPWFKVKESDKGTAWSSRELAKLWPLGFSSFGSVTYDSAAYVAGYTCKKAHGQLAEVRYSRVDVSTGEVIRVVPEFGHMSLKPGIGYSWYQKYWKEVHKARDGVVLKGGVTVPPPKYYDKLLGQLDGFLKDEKDYERFVRSEYFLEDTTEARLLVREKCAKAKASFLKRSI